MNQPELFDPAATGPQQCPVCGATRNPDEPDVNCEWEQKRDALEQYLGRRPRSCLNTYDPATAPFPDGY